MSSDGMVWKIVRDALMDAGGLRMSEKFTYEEYSARVDVLAADTTDQLAALFRASPVSRDAVLAEAARVCEKYAADWESHGFSNEQVITQECAKKIRALKSEGEG